MTDTQQQIHYEQVAWMEPIKARDGSQYLLLGKVTNPSIKNTYAVTPVHGKGETMFFCIEHEEAYRINGICTGCRMQVREEANG